MKPITSLFDFFLKVKQDKRYKKVLILAYQRSGYRKGGWDRAKFWLDDWIKCNREDTCYNMVYYLNDFIKDIPGHNDPPKPKVVKKKINKLCCQE